MSDKEINVCCRLLTLLPCFETEGHQHIVWQAKDGTTGNPLLDNEHVKKYCIGDTEIFSRCPYYPRQG